MTLYAAKREKIDFIGAGPTKKTKGLLLKVGGWWFALETTKFYLVFSFILTH